ncbi:MAG: hypothetical protein JOZ60_00335 [Verrucomicrobia bacterium]|nr:hypothetical protein [Verrucomicrobiota bacterium]
MKLPLNITLPYRAGTQFVPGHPQPSPSPTAAEKAAANDTDALAKWDQQTRQYF